MYQFGRSSIFSLLDSNIKNMFILCLAFLGHLILNHYLNSITCILGEVKFSVAGISFLSWLLYGVGHGKNCRCKNAKIKKAVLGALLTCSLPESIKICGKPLL